MSIHCSACGTPLPAGSNHCRGCGLLLTAHAVPTIKRRPSLWPWLLMAAACAILIMVVGAGLHQHAQASLLEELHAGSFTLQALEARCGRADQVDMARGVLRYGSTLVELHSGAPVTYATLHTYTRGGRQASIRIPVEEDVALGDLHCGGAR